MTFGVYYLVNRECFGTLYYAAMVAVTVLCGMSLLMKHFGNPSTCLATNDKFSELPMTCKSQPCRPESRPEMVEQPVEPVVDSEVV